MIQHPLTLALLLLETLSLVVYLAAAAKMFFILARGQTGEDLSSRPAHERELEVIGLQGRWAALLLGLAFLVLLIGISNVWPAIVPGAMCGMGVLEATGPAGRQALLLEGAALLVMYSWWAVEQVEDKAPRAGATGLLGRLLLLASPFWVMGFWSLIRALVAVDSAPAVSCCAVVYDRALGTGGGNVTAMADPRWWIGLGLVSAAAALVWCRGIRRWSASPDTGVRCWPVALIWAGLPVAYMIVTRLTAPYILQVLEHPCPWCLMLADHGGAGFILFGLPLWVAAEGAAALAGIHLAQHDSGMATWAAQRVRVAGGRIIVGTIFFAVFAAAPGFWWLVRFGRWIR